MLCPHTQIPEVSLQTGWHLPGSEIEEGGSVVVDDDDDDDDDNENDDDDYYTAMLMMQLVSAAILEFILTSAAGTLDEMKIIRG